MDGVLVPGSIEEQTLLTLGNLVKTVEALGGSRDSILRCSCYLADISEFDSFDKCYRSFFVNAFPARTTVGVKLPAGMRIEIDCVVAVQMDTGR